MEAGEAFAHLVGLQERLLAEGGCPWDREQTLASLRRYVLEEANEVVSAINRLLDVEAEIRATRGLPAADASPPQPASGEGEDGGDMHAHHPQREDFSQGNSASGAPLGKGSMPPELARKWARAKAEFCEEVGDLIMQPVFQAKLAEKLGYFTLVEAIDGIYRKLVRRHPHVFGDARADTPDEVLDSWNAIKREEKNRDEGGLS